MFFFFKSHFGWHPSDFLQDALAELGRISSEALQLLRTVRALGAEDQMWLWWMDGSTVPVLRW